MKSKILIIGPSSTHVSRFIELIKDLFDEIVFVGEDYLKADDSIRQHRVNFRSTRPAEINRNYNKLRSIINGENPTITHIHLVNRVAYMASRILSREKRLHVVTTWGSDVLVVPQKSTIYRSMVKRVLKYADFITADSRDMMAHISQLTSNKNTGLVYFGVEPLKSLPKEKIIFSNRALLPIYNIEGIIQEYYGFHKLYPDWKLIIAGVGDKRSELQTLVEGLGLTSQIEFVGWLSPERNHDYYRRASIYISLPFNDGTSVSLLEAMSAGCIPVVSDLPVAYEWIKNGENGVIKSPDKNALVQAISIDHAKAEKINVSLIDTLATGKISTQRFKEIYHELLNATTTSK